MSIVRYNNRDEDKESSLSILVKNSSSNALVAYNSATNNLELVRLDSPLQQESSGASPDFRIPNTDRRRRSSANSTYTTNTQYIYCPNCGFQMSSMNNDHEENSESSSGHNHPGFGGDFLRRDYFKLLGKLESNSELNQELIRSIFTNPANKVMLGGTGSSSTNKKIFKEQLPNILPTGIPIELINQGYFTKFFKVLKELGNGSNGKVLKVEHELFGLNLGIFALKKIAIGNNIDNLIRILDEVKFLYSLSENSDLDVHSNIIKYNHVWLEVDQISEFGPKVPVVFILFEYCDGGTLEEFVESIAHPKFDLNQERLIRRWKRKNPNETAPVIGRKKARFLNNFEIFKIFNDIVNGVQCLHKSKIIHRDLKPSNCLFKSQFPENYFPIESTLDFHRIPTLIVSDFGESIMENTQRNSTGATGTLEFCAPELFEIGPDGKLKDFSYSSDIYSLGLILYYLCFSKLPFRSNGPALIREEISKFQFLDDIEKTRRIGDDPKNQELILPEWIDMIKQLTTYDPNSRPNSDHVALFMKSIYQKLDYTRFPESSFTEETDEAGVTSGIEVKRGILHQKHDFILPVDFRALIIATLAAINIAYPSDSVTLNNLHYLLVGLSISPSLRNYILACQLFLFTLKFVF